MASWQDSPIVSFSRGGRAIELGRSGEDPVLHLYGSTGLGLAPVSVDKSDRVGGDGSIVRGVRYSDREVYIPLFAEKASMGALNDWRRDLTRLLAPTSGDPEDSLVDVTIEDPTTGTKRTARGIYTDGLSGDFGDEYHGEWQTLGITLDCADPWWLGPERTRTLELNPGTKPFLSDGEVVFKRRNLAVNPRFESLAGQLGSGSITGSSGASVALSSVWASQGSTSLMVTPNGTNNSSAARFGPATAGLQDVTFAGQTITAAVDLHLEEEQTGSLSSTARSILIGYVNASGADTNLTGNWSTPAPNEAGDHRVTVTATIPEDAQGIYLYVRNGSTTQPMWIDGLTIELGDTDGDYFDGDTDGAYWSNEVGASPSFILEAGSAVPFFPVILAESVVQDVWTITVEGDTEVWPTWEVTGPGEDLLIESEDARIYIDGTFTAGTVTRIDTTTGRITPDRWDDVSLDSQLFPLQPGPNRIKVSMVAASVDTTVRLVWQERYLEGI